jgi:hypothetical protein
MHKLTRPEKMAIVSIVQEAYLAKAELADRNPWDRNLHDIAKFYANILEKIEDSEWINDS